MKKADIEIFEEAVRVLGLKWDMKTVAHDGTPWYAFHHHGKLYTGWTFDLDGSFVNCFTRDYENRDVRPLEESMIKLLGLMIQCKFSDC